MADLDRAKEIVVKAEAGLRQLMEKALADQRYRDLADVAPLADSLAELSGLRSKSTDMAPANAGRSSVLPHRAPAAIAQSAKPPRKDDDYPRFARDGDKLVKIAWSKKDRREYEHRAPRAAVFRVADVLTTRVKRGAVFRMDTLLPFQDDEGKDTPSYQAYLALAWFRKLGAVEERGKDGYVVVEGELDSASLEKKWDDTNIAR